MNILNCMLLRYKRTYNLPSFKSNSIITFSKPFLKKGSEIKKPTLTILNEDWKYEGDVLFHLTIENVSDKKIQIAKIKFDFGNNLIKEVLYKNNKFTPNESSTYIEIDNILPNSFVSMRLVCKNENFKDLEIEAEDLDVRVHGADVLYNGSQVSDF